MISTPTLELDPDPVFADALCARVRCPARDPCLAYALSGDMPGVWGGTTRRERARMRRARKRGE